MPTNKPGYQLFSHKRTEFNGSITSRHPSSSRFSCLTRLSWNN